MNSPSDHQIVWDEIRSNYFVKSLQAKAVSESLDDEKKALALYIQLRVSQLRAKKDLALSGKSRGQLVEEIAFSLAEKAGFKGDAAVLWQEAEDQVASLLGPDGPSSVDKV